MGYFMLFNDSKWIWIAEGESRDQYGEFKDTFTCGGRTLIRISVDGDYTLFVNEKYVSSGQYGDFEHYKIYDEIDISDFCNDGENAIRIIVYHPGIPTQRYLPCAAGLIYEVVSDGKTVAKSSEDTPSRLASGYISGREILISSQLGFGFGYNFKDTGNEYVGSLSVEKDCTFFARPIKKASHLPAVPMKTITTLPSGTYLIDLGEEVVGLLSIDIYSSTEQKIRIAYGEHIADGKVRSVIGNRNFYLDFETRVGQNVFTERMLRIACRYLEVSFESNIVINYVGVIPEVYPIAAHKNRPENKIDREIYSICENTLKLCMMEHYVDCPWREQALYAFDSRNQMLCGYYVYEGGNAEYARANLKLIGMDKRDDGLLSICYPAGSELAIPSFSLYYFLSMKEYIEHTGDTSLAKELYPKLISIIDAFFKNSDGGLMKKFTGKQNWNFYDWSEFASGTLGRSEESIPDLLINSLFVIALDSFSYICKKAELSFPYANKAAEIKKKINEHFYIGDGIYTVTEGSEQYTVLGNALAILSGAANGRVAEACAEKIISAELHDCSLSMKVLEYDALLAVNKEKYSDVILAEIRSNYKKMLDFGSTTVWETIDGESAFYNAGSLCHGWSSIPIYIYHKLGLC